MARTIVGLFESPRLVDGVVLDLEASGFSRGAVRILGEPLDMAGRNAMSIPHTDFEVGLIREFRTIGAAEADAEAYVEGVRRGGVIIFATGSDETTDTAAAEIMNRHGAVDIEELSTSEEHLPSTGNDTMTFSGNSSVQTGRVRSPGGGARLFVW